jgi:hypothetical protein
MVGTKWFFCMLRVPEIIFDMAYDAGGNLFALEKLWRPRSQRRDELAAGRQTLRFFPG